MEQNIDTHAHIVPLIQAIRRRIALGQDRQYIFEDLADRSSIEDLYLTYTAATLMEKWFPNG